MKNSIWKACEYATGISEKARKGYYTKIGTSITSHIGDKTRESLRKKGLGHFILKQGQKKEENPIIKTISERISDTMSNEKIIKKEEKLKMIERFSGKVETYLADCMKGDREYKESEIENCYQESLK